MSDQTQLEMLKSNLFKHCVLEKSGTAFISTKNNKSCQIKVTDGKVIAVTMGRSNGCNAILEMNKVGIKAASFRDEMQIPHKVESTVESSDDVLKILGYTDSLIDIDELLKDPTLYFGRDRRNKDNSTSFQGKDRRVNQAI